MKAYVISLAVGVLVGMIYSALHVRSPAPPTIALVGLLGILLGEQLLPLGQKWWQGGSHPDPVAEARPAEVPTPPPSSSTPLPHATTTTGHAPSTAGTPPPSPGPDG